MIKPKLLLLLFILSGIFSACKKDDGPPPSKTNLLIGPKVWKLSAWSVTPGLILQNGTVVTDLYGILPATSKDDVMKFYQEPATYIEEEGATKSAGAAQIIDAGNWFLSINETDLFLASSSGRPSSYTIVELTNTSFKFSYVDVGSNGNSRTYTKTYVAQ